MRKAVPLGIISLIAVLAIAVTGLRAARAETASESGNENVLIAEKVLAEAGSIFREANEMALSDPGRARELYEAAARKFEHLIVEEGYTNGELYTNLANTWFLAGDYGRSILNYRRARTFSPRDRFLEESLAHARAQCVDVFSFSEAGEIRRAVFFWHYWLGQRTRMILFGAAYAALWVIAGWRLFEPRRRFAVARRVCLVVCLTVGVSALVHAVTESRSRPGVVVAPEVVARKGDSYIYEPALTNALHSGAEFTLIERRGDWVHARFGNGEVAWLPATSVAFVDAFPEEGEEDGAGGLLPSGS